MGFVGRFSFMIRAIAGIISAGKTSAPIEINLTPESWDYRAATFPQTTYSLISSFSEYPFSTDAPFLDFTCYTTLQPTWIKYAQIGVYIGGELYQTITFVSGDANKVVVKRATLPGGSVQGFIRLGLGMAVSETLIYGTNLTKITTVGGSYFNRLTTIRKSKRRLILGDSISVGFTTSNPIEKAYINIMRKDSRLSDYEVASYGYGGYSVGFAMNTPAKRTALVAAHVAYFAGANDKVIYVTLQTNDYNAGLGVPLYISYLGLYYDELHSADPDIKFVQVTATPRVIETANNGYTLDDYRNAMPGLATGRPYILRTLSGPAIVKLAFTDADGLHFSDYGNVLHAEYFTRDILSISQLPFFQLKGQYMQAGNSATGYLSAALTTNNDLRNYPAKTICFTARRDRESSTDPAISQGTASTSFWIGYGNGNTFRVTLNGSSTNGYVDFGKSQVPIDFEPHRWGVGIDGTTIYLYIEGLFVAKVVKTLAQGAVGALRIGNYNNSNTTMALDAVRIYNKLLSPAEFMADRLTETITDFTGVIADYELNGNGVDSSPNANNATVGAAVTFPVAP